MRLTICACLLLVALLMGCSSSPAAPLEPTAPELASLRSSLATKAAGVTDWVGDLREPQVHAFPTAIAYTELPVGRGRIEVHSFGGQHQADVAASKIRPDGTTAVISFNGVPHWFKWQRSLLLYVERPSAENTVVVSELRKRYGEEFAGGRP